MVYFTYNIPSLINITNMFSNWLNGVDKTDKARIRIGVSALCWSMWTYQNNFMFNKHVGTNFLQPYGCALDTIMVHASPGGSAGAYGYWVQPVADGNT
jgi:hypothetical protein